MGDLQTVLERAEYTGKATGLISDLMIYDATPAVFAAHAENRNDKLEITHEMFEHDIEVYLSGGYSDTQKIGPIPPGRIIAT